jgi:hypothetical protein
MHLLYHGQLLIAYQFLSMIRIFLLISAYNSFGRAEGVPFAGAIKWALHPKAAC